MKFKIINIIFLILIFLSNCYAELKIFAVQSYDINNICGEPQIIGFKNYFNNNKEVLIRTYYLDHRNKSKTEYMLNVESKQVILKIEKFNPDYVIFFDDGSFEYIGIRLLQNKYPYKIGFSGINKPIEEYVDQYGIKKNEIFGVCENIDFNKLNILLDIFTNTRKVIVLFDSNDLSKFIMNKVLKTIKEYTSKHYIRVEPVFINTKSELKYYLLTNINDKNIILINCLFQIKDEANNILGLKDISYVYNKYSNNNINIFFSNKVINNASISIFNNFELMGRNVAKMIMSNTKTILNANTEVWVNMQNIPNYNDNIYKIEKCNIITKIILEDINEK